ncbi:hypothetical protein HBB16_14035 [Pseudonocardia sp. MCCB 268]|nr:hypothetical protein [Pseudonocardia cytotoxica]
MQPERSTAGCGRDEFVRFLDAVPADVPWFDEALRRYATDPDAVPPAVARRAPQPRGAADVLEGVPMAGLRAGYALASAEAVATALRKVAPPFGVNSVA